MLPHLRPMDTGEILDGAFRLYRMHFRAFLAAGPLSPLLLCWAYVLRRTWAGVPLDVAGLAGLTAMLFFGGWVPGVFTRAMVFRMADDAQTGRPADGRAACVSTLRRLPGLLWASALTNLLIALPVVLGASVTGQLSAALGDRMPLILMGVSFLLSAGLAAAWSGALPAVVLERTSGNGGRGRSWALSRGGVRKVGAVWTVGFLLVWLPWIAVEALLGLFIHTPASGLSFVMSALLFQASTAVSVPLVAAARALLFNDLRVRVEAFDVRVAAERLAPAGA